MTIEVSDFLGAKFKAAAKKAEEDEQFVIERMMKTYVYEVHSRYVETFEGLELFLTRPKPLNEAQEP